VYAEIRAVSYLAGMPAQYVQVLALLMHGTCGLHAAGDVEHVAAVCEAQGSCPAVLACLERAGGYEVERAGSVEVGYEWIVI
jgi:hypothetical protein